MKLDVSLVALVFQKVFLPFFVGRRLGSVRTAWEAITVVTVRLFWLRVYGTL